MYEPMLAGLRILDFSRALAGPTCTRMLVEMGAEIIKVEAAPGGDLTRQHSPPGVVGKQFARTGV